MSDALWGKLFKRYWDDAEGLSTDAKLAGAFMLISPHTKRTGVIKITYTNVGEGLEFFKKGKDREVDVARTRKAFSEACEHFNWQYDENLRVLYIPTYYKYNNPASSKTLMGSQADIDDMPRNGFFLEWVRSTKKFLHSFLYKKFDEMIEEQRVKMTGVEAPEKPATPLESPTKAGKPKEKKDLSEGFQEFYDAYPKKKSKPQAEKAWRHLSPSPELRAEIMKDVAAKTKTEDWTKDNRQYCPHPATYLNNNGWADQAPTPEQNTDPNVFEEERENA